MKTKKWLSLTLSAALATVSLSACSGNANNTNASASGSAAPSASAPASSGADVKLDPVTIKWYVNLSWWKYPGEWGTDKFSQFVRDKFGLNIEFQTPAADDGQKLASMIASADVPDLITVEAWNNSQKPLIQAGLVQPLDDLIPKYAPTFRDEIYNDVWNWYKAPDGKNYGLPNYAYSSEQLKPGQKLEPNGGFTLRKDIYDQLGRPDVSSPDQFLSVLERVKNEVKTYDGKPLIPLQLYDGIGSSVNWLIQYFNTSYEDKDGNWVDVRFQPHYYEALKFLNEANNRGLISKDNFTDTRDAINEKVASGRVFSMMTAPQDFSNANGPMRTLFQADNKAQYETFVLKNYEGEDPVLQDIRGMGWLLTMVGKNTKYADRITKLLQFLNSDEGQYMIQFGWEGETYTKTSDGLYAPTQEYLDLNKTGKAAPKWGMGFNLLANWLTVKDLIPPQTDPEEKYLQELKKPLEQYSYNLMANTNRIDSGDPRWNEMRQKEMEFSNYWNKQLVRMITAKSEADLKKNYDESLAQLKKMGWEKWYDFQNEGYQKTKEILGMKNGYPTGGTNE
ncbi:extracellular solute-binding protein [Cohnella sp. 56]|uniref:extracellular solute-binding protein n=1 Tax=Cohnella sp. 56 TaxID=3113722 RepID=UPI0030EB0BBD